MFRTKLIVSVVENGARFQLASAMFRTKLIVSVSASWLTFPISECNVSHEANSACR